MVLRNSNKWISISLNEVCILPPTLKQIAFTELQYVYLLSSGLITFDYNTCSSFPYSESRAKANAIPTRIAIHAQEIHNRQFKSLFL